VRCCQIRHNFKKVLGEGKCLIASDIIALHVGLHVRTRRRTDDVVLQRTGIS